MRDEEFILDKDSKNVVRDDTLFGFKEVVKITKGFYKGMIGTVSDYSVEADGIVYTIHISSQKINVLVSEVNLRRLNVLEKLLGGVQK